MTFRINPTLRSIFLCLVASALSATAQITLFRQVADTKTDTHVELVSLFNHPSLGGYFPVRVLATNRQKIPHRISLRFADATNYGESLSASSDFSFLIAPGKTLARDILVPLAPQNGSASYHSFTANLTGSMGDNQSNVSTVFLPGQPNVLLSSELYSSNASTLDSSLATSSSSSTYGRTSEGFASSFDPKRLPDDWRAYSGFDSMLLSEADWSQIPPGQRNAIISWVRLGGQLVVFSSSSPTKAALGLPEDSSFGRILIRRVADLTRLDPAATIALTNAGTITPSRMNSVTNDFKSSWPLQKAFGEKSFHYVLFVVILIAFGILVAPVNLFVFAKSGQRHRLFVTTPLISLGTSLLLIVLIIFQDGFGGDGSRAVLMEVRPDDNQNAAFLHQEQFSRTGVVTSPSFSVDASALIVPLPLARSRWARLTDDHESTGSYNIQPADGKLFAKGDWFQSRSEQGQLVSAVVPTRGRIEASATSDTLVSTFDFPIETLIYQDPQGNWFRASDVRKGTAPKLTPIDPTMAQTALTGFGKIFAARNREYLKSVQDRRDHFIALTNAAPAVGTHPGIDWKTTTVITGPVAR